VNQARAASTGLGSLTAPSEFRKLSDLTASVASGVEIQTFCLAIIPRLGLIFAPGLLLLFLPPSDAVGVGKKAPPSFSSVWGSDGRSG
jgi:hypothetical protein